MAPFSAMSGILFHGPENTKFAESLSLSLYVSSAVGGLPPSPRSGFAWLAGVMVVVAGAAVAGPWLWAGLGHSGLAVGCQRRWPFACPQWAVDALQCATGAVAPIVSRLG